MMPVVMEMRIVRKVVSPVTSEMQNLYTLVRLDVVSLTLLLITTRNSFQLVAV